MRRIYGLFLLVALLLVGATNIWAQDDAPTCDAVAAADVLAGLVEALRTADSPVDALGAIALAAGAAASDCAGLSFSSDDITANKVIGPITFEPGIYIAKLEAEPDDYISLEVTELEGDCNIFAGYIFASSNGGDQKVLEIENGCTGLLSFTVSTLDFSKDGPVWSITIEKVD